MTLYLVMTKYGRHKIAYNLIEAEDARGAIMLFQSYQTKSKWLSNSSFKHPQGYKVKEVKMTPILCYYDDDWLGFLQIKGGIMDICDIIDDYLWDAEDGIDIIYSDSEERK